MESIVLLTEIHTYTRLRRRDCRKIFWLRSCWPSCHGMQIPRPAADLLHITRCLSWNDTRTVTPSAEISAVADGFGVCGNITIFVKDTRTLSAAASWLCRVGCRRRETALYKVPVLWESDRVLLFHCTCIGWHGYTHWGIGVCGGYNKQGEISGIRLMSHTT